jgi:steroid 5-alpha reductase family enzyme
MFDRSLFGFESGLLAFGAIAGLAVAAWLVSLKKKDVSIVDGLWPVFIWAGAIVYACTAALSPSAWMALALLTFWAARLCVHIVIRNHGEPEDRRYQKIRANNLPHFEWKSLYIVFLLQAVLAWIVALPFMAIARGAPGVTLLKFAGFALAAFGILFEALGDWQLVRFKASPDSRGRVLDTGLWRYSRHPNYFGECCTWWGFGLLGLSAGAWWSVLSPLLMTVLLLKVSGVTMLEADIGERRPDYARYMRETSPFFPRKPKRPHATRLM